MAIVAKKRKVEGQLKGPQVNVLKLMQPTDIHPNGRIQLDAATGTIKGPRNNVLYKTKKRINGREVELSVNGGHARATDSVWRIALSGPSRYFWKLMRDEMAYRLRGIRSTSAPKLDDGELLEARQFVAYLLDTKAANEQVLPADFMNKKHNHGMRDIFTAIDAGFYAWLKKQENLTDLPPVTAAFVFLPL